MSIIDIQSQTVSGLTTVFNNVTSSQTAGVYDLGGYDIITVQVSGTGTLKIKTALDSSVDMSATQSKTNIWAYAGISDLIDNSIVTGSTGVTVSGTSKMIEINVNSVQYFGFEVSGNTSGITVQFRAYKK